VYGTVRTVVWEDSCSNNGQPPTRSKNLTFGKIFLIFSKNAENQRMIINGIEFWTVKEMAKELGLDPTVIKQRLFTAQIHPFTRDALYPASALEAIRKVPGKGRPVKKVKAPEPHPKAAEPSDQG
jgi:hypothetical protein